jgi:hypothetical protein
MTRSKTFVAVAVAVGVLGATATMAVATRGTDRGEWEEHELESHAMSELGVGRPLPGPSANQVDASTAEADPTTLVTLAGGLRARVVTADPAAAPNVDMMALWPDDVHPTHLIVCNEQGTAQPGVQRIALATGAVETILSGTTSCDPAHRTPWGTVVVGEEAADGRVLEILDPLHTTGVAYDRGTQTLVDTVGADESAHVAVRSALGQLAFEGLGIYGNGVAYYGDENRPANGTPGGAYFKFVPASPWAGGPSITDLAASPLASGQVYGLRLGRRSGNTDYGQGSETGEGTWVPVASGMLRTIAATEELTGYYRPEDISIDRAAEADGLVRFCGNNTGNEDFGDWGTTICVTDGSLDDATAGIATPAVQLLVAGDPELAMMDNLAYQPHRGNWIVHEDGEMLTGNNDLWSCLDDGGDRDVLSDGCIRIGTLNDGNAEWTGGLFNADGTRFYVSVQHNITGHGVVLEISGWR